VMYEIVVVLIDRIRRENILFSRTPPPDESGSRRPIQVFA